METYGLEKLGLVNAGAVYRNLTPAPVSYTHLTLPTKLEV